MRTQNSSLAFQLPLQLERVVTLDAPDAIGPPLDRHFPAQEAEKLAALESFNKHLYRPNTYLHKWWARRSGTTFRYILKQLVRDPEKRDYYAPGGLEGLVILDPMMGGGTTLHEALRLGAAVVGVDIDPIPVLQARASLSFIPIEEKVKAFDNFYEKLRSRLEPFFRTHCPGCRQESVTQFMLYGLRKRCDCGEAVFVDTLCLREETNGNGLYLNPLTGEVQQGEAGDPGSGARLWLYVKGTRECPYCRKPFCDLEEEPFVGRYTPLVVVGDCKLHGQFFKRVEAGDLACLQQAREYADKHIRLPTSGLDVPAGPKSNDLLKRGIASFGELFTPRQKIYIAACKELLDAAPEKHRLWLGLLISTSLELNSILCGFKGWDRRRAGAIRHVFSHHAYSFPYTALENNPVFGGGTSGALPLLFQDRIVSAFKWADAPVERKPVRGEWKKVILSAEKDWGIPVRSYAQLTSPRAFLVAQQNSSRLNLPDASVDHIVTDPPYFDSVQYSDLAHFFRAWLKWFLPTEAEWNYDVGESAVAETAEDGAKYQSALTAIWRECHRVLRRPAGRLVFTFHHWRPEAWARLTSALKDAGFRLVTSYTVYSENPTSVHIRQLRALKHDSILVLQPEEVATRAPFPALPRIRGEDSATFCSDCAALLGYCLDAEMSQAEINALWQNAITG